MKNLRLLCLTLTLSFIANAHDLYLLPDSFHVQKGEKLRVALHNGDSFPESEAAVNLARLKNPVLMGRGSTSPVLDLHITGNETAGQVVVPEGGNLWLSVSTLPNFIELEAAKFEAYLKEEGLPEIIDWRKQNGESQKAGRERYSKYAKSLLLSGSPDDFYKQPINFPVEIIPLSNPSAIKAGGSLPIRVLFRGKPAAGLQLESAWAFGKVNKTTVVGRTDSDGRISVPIASSGKYRLHALKMERCSEPKVADWESFWASVTFEIR